MKEKKPFLAALIALAIFAYVLWPLDLVPDVAFPVGYVDDAVVVAGVTYFSVKKHFSGASS